MAEPAHCRVGRVRMKGGGADVRVLTCGSSDAIGQEMLRFARQQAAESAPLGGFVLVTWDAEGGYQVSANMPAGPIPLTLLPSWMAEVVRRELVTSRQVHQVLERDFDVTPPRRPPA